MEGVTLTGTGLERARAIIGENSGKGTKGDKFSDVFSNKDTTVTTFDSFFTMKIAQIADNQSRGRG